MMALPWLESLPVWGAEPMAARGRAQAARGSVHGQRRQPDQWWAKGSGADMELGRASRRWSRSKASSTTSRGCSTRRRPASAFIPGMTGNLLSGAPLTKGRGAARRREPGSGAGQPHRRPDRAAQHGPGLRAAGHRLPRDELLDGLQLAHLVVSPTSPVPMEVYPSLAFDSLFENRGSQRNQSVLDRVREQVAVAQPAGQLRGQGRSSTNTSPASATSRSARRTCARRKRRPTRARPAVAGVAATMARPDNGLPEDIRDHMRLMCDILALAFQTDKTRIATLLLCRDISGLFYPFLDVKLAHHLASHEDTGDAFMRINQFYLTPVRLPDRQARRDARGRGHRARQLLPRVHVEHVVRQPARQHARCPC